MRPSPSHETGQDPHPRELTAVLIIADDRTSGQVALDSLYAQTIADRMEIILYDMGHPGQPNLQLDDSIPTEYVLVPENESWAKIRAEGIRRAHTPIVAFLEDHCIAENQWADALVQAHQGPWACVGYAFTNPNPNDYLSRAGFIAELGLWMHPAQGGLASILPFGNVAYKRDLLLAFGDELEILLTPDLAMHERLLQMHLPLYVDANARVSHATMVRFGDMLLASFAVCRVMSAHRVQTQSWSLRKRLAYAALTPIMSPSFALLRLAVSPRHRRSHWIEVVSSLPVVLIRGICAALGESIGYAFGAGSASLLTDVELYKKRNPP